MRTTTLAVLMTSLLLVAPAVTTAAADTPASGLCPVPAAQVERAAGAEVVMVPLPGKLLGYAAPQGEASARDLFLLVGPVDTDDGKSASSSSIAQTVRRLKAEGVFDGIEAENVRLIIEAVDGEEIESFNVVLKKNAAGDAEAARDCPAVETVATPTLFVLRPGSLPTLFLVRDDLPAEARALLAVDIDGDGQGEILVETVGELLVVPVGGGMDAAPLRSLLSDAELSTRNDEPRGVRFPPEPVAIHSPFDDSSEVSPRRNRAGARYVAHGWSDDPAHIRVTGLGELRLYGPGEETAAWRLVARIPLPVRTSADPSLLLVTSPQVRTVGRTAAGTLFLAAGPVPYGADRLKTVVVELGAGEPRVQEAWSRVREGDQIENSGYLLMDDQPYFWVTTENDTSVSLFGGDNEQFRLFRLSRDRTRAGGEAVLDIKADKLPLSGNLKAGADVNGDGRDDLILAGQRNTPRLVAFLQREDGRFSRSAKMQEIDQNGGPISLRDLDGDGVRDMLVQDGEAYRIYSGLAARKTRTMVTTEPHWKAPRLVPAASTPPHHVACSERKLLDLDGDGRQEIVCAGSDGHGRAAIKIVRFTRPTD